MSTPGSAPHRVAVIGAGPSGFYAAEALLDAGEDGGTTAVEVDVFDRLATPWGLVRSGVAPDHPKIKSVSAQYAKTAARPGFRFFGHVEFGEHVARDELLDRYDAVVYAVGSQTDRRLGVPGEELPGCLASVDFVGWYNGHPDHAGLEPDLSAERAVVVGAGNVALDVARMLLLPDEDLRATDTADHALDAFAASGVREVVLCGRRGTTQASFTTTELRELDDIDGLATVVAADRVPAADDPAIADASKGTRRNLDILRRWSEAEADAQASRTLEFRFLRSPVELRGNGRVEEIVLGVNRLEPDDDGRLRAVDTGEREVVPCGVVLRAVGYKGAALPDVPFDDASGTIPNHEGRVTNREREYVVGWIKRGPSGIIGTNRKDAAETVRHVLADLAERPRALAEPPSSRDVEQWLHTRCPDLVDQSGWEAIDAHECGRGADSGRPRVKVIDRATMIELAGRSAADRSTEAASLSGAP